MFWDFCSNEQQLNLSQKFTPFFFFFFLSKKRDTQMLCSISLKIAKPFTRNGHWILSNMIKELMGEMQNKFNQGEIYCGF